MSKSEIESVLVTWALGGLAAVVCLAWAVGDLELGFMASAAAQSVPAKPLYPDQPEDPEVEQNQPEVQPGARREDGAFNQPSLERGLTDSEYPTADGQDQGAAATQPSGAAEDGLPPRQPPNASWDVLSRLGRLFKGSSTQTNKSRDPFSPSPVMQDEAMRSGSGLQFLPGVPKEKIPTLRLKGFIEDTGKKRVALIEVEAHGVFLVREDDDISLQRGGDNLVLRIVSITDRSVVVEAGTLGHIVVVR